MKLPAGRVANKISSEKILFDKLHYFAFTARDQFVWKYNSVHLHTYCKIIFVLTNCKNVKFLEKHKKIYGNTHTSIHTIF
jgi:hypothetical protein